MTPDFDSLIGDGVEPGERERLRRAHEALLAAGPPPELPLGLARAPGRARRLRPLLLLAATLALAAAFLGGWLAGRAGGQAADFTLVMEGTAAASSAHAAIDVYPIDEAGNWPMRMTVTGLSDGRYELVLTRAGKRAASCGFFLVHGRTIATLNAPYRLRAYDGWAVIRPHSDRFLLKTAEA